MQVFVQGIGVWAPRMPNWRTARAVIRGEMLLPDTVAKRPSGELLASNERRRAPDTVLLALEVAAAACADAELDPKLLPSIFASTHGDLTVCDSMSTTLAASPELVSPTKFHNSVHNAAVGYWTIATGAIAASTALSAANETFAEGLLEAAAYALSEQRPVLFVAYDIQVVGGLASVTQSDGLFGVALVIAPTADKNSKCQLNVELVDLPARGEGRAAVVAGTSPAAAAVSGNALAGVLPALERIAHGDTQSLVLPLARQCGLSLTVSVPNVGAGS